jgi:hypothetical protein
LLRNLRIYGKPDWKEWRRLLLEAKVHSGLHCLRRREEEKGEEEEEAEEGEANGITFNMRKSAKFCGLQFGLPS